LKSNGPLPEPYDTGELWVPKSLFDGKRRIIWGTVRDLDGNRDTGQASRAEGSVSLPREIYSDLYGKHLYQRPVTEITEAFTDTALDIASQPLPTNTDGTWKYKNGKLECESSEGLCSFRVPDDYMLQCTVQLDPAATLTVGLRQQPDMASYPMVINPAKSEISIARGQTRHTQQVELDASTPITIQAFVLGTILECFVNDRYAFTLRVCDFLKGDLSLQVQGGQLQVLDLSIKTLRPEQTAEPAATTDSQHSSEHRSSIFSKQISLCGPDSKPGFIDIDVTGMVGTDYKRDPEPVAAFRLEMADPETLDSTDGLGNSYNIWGPMPQTNDRLPTLVLSFE